MNKRYTFMLLQICAATLMLSCDIGPQRDHSAKPTEVTPHFALAASGDRVVKLDTLSGRSWVLEPNSSKWQLLADDRVGTYNPKTGKIEWDAGQPAIADAPAATTTSDVISIDEAMRRIDSSKERSKH